ncbi:MAG: chitobiase/beta-hexosaminidase C-terminal domain-containing protein [Fibrobacteria bacterium]
MNPSHACVAKTRLRLAQPLLAAVLALSAFFLSSLSGCIGGTSTEAGNPGLTLEFQEDGRNVEVSGTLQLFVANSNPEFYISEPNDVNGSDPHVDIVTQVRPVAVFFPVPSRTLTLSRKEVLLDLLPRARLGLQKTSAAKDKTVLPDFNIVVDVKGNRISLLAGIHMDPESGKFSVIGGGNHGDNLIVDISQERNYSGTVDTSTAAGKPIALFVPGTNFSAQVHKGKFTFFDLPEKVRMPMRWVSANGEIRDMPDSLGSSWTKPLQPGERVDSIALPNLVAVQPPSAMPAGQFTFTDSVSVALSSEAGAFIYYSLDGSLPDNHSAPYRGPLVIRSSATLKAVAYINGRIKSAVSVNNYTLVPSQPVTEPASQTFRDTLRIALTTKSENGVIHYTLDGSEPGAGSRLYTQPFLIDSTTTLKAVTDVPGLGWSLVTEEKYIRLADSLPSNPVDSLPAMPSADPPAGTYSDTVRVSLTTATSGAVIYFTLDGSEPGVTSSLYSGGPLVLAANTTIKAVAVSGKGKSPVMSGVYLVSLPNPP